MVFSSMERIQAAELVELPGDALETAIRRYVAALGGSNGAAALNLRVPGTASCDCRRVRVHLDAMHARDADCEAHDVLTLSWAPCEGCACPMFSGTVLTWGLAANLSYLALDGTFEYQATSGKAMRAAPAREGTVEIGRAILKLLASVSKALHRTGRLMALSDVDA